MLSALTVGVWFSIICTINESTLLGFGKPYYAAVGNGLKLAWLVVGIVMSIGTYGVAGAIIIVLTSDAWRYVPILIGQRREHFSFVSQDIMITMIFLGLIAAGEWARWSLGLGTSFSALLPLLQ
jgi:O-antigen/teichoic acid export membrane protein